MARTLLLLATPPPAPHLLMAVLLFVAAAAAAATTTDNTGVNVQANVASSTPPPPSSSSTSTTSPPPSSSSSSTTPPPPPPPPLSSSSTGYKTEVTPATSSSSSSNNNNASSPENSKGFYKGMSREFVNEHNKVRARYGAPAVAWDKTLALYARRWANQIQGDCDKARHSEKKMYGECFFLGTNGTAQDALCSWEKEEDVYDRGTFRCTPGHNFHDCGHFAIMVNKDWRWVGCGRAPCTQGPRQGQFFISCSYAGVKPNATDAAATP